MKSKLYILTIGLLLLSTLLSGCWDLAAARGNLRGRAGETIQYHKFLRRIGKCRS